MYQEDAEHYEHERQLVELERERRQGTGMVDMKRDDWLVCACGGEDFTREGACMDCGSKTGGEAGWEFPKGG